MYVREGFVNLIHLMRALSRMSILLVRYTYMHGYKSVVFNCSSELSLFRFPEALSNYCTILHIPKYFIYNSGIILSVAMLNTNR
jgi:hypothetical protein